MTFQVSPTGLWNQPFAPSGAAGEVTAATAGGVASSAMATLASACRKPQPQSPSGCPSAEVQSIIPRGSLRIAYSSSTLSDGFADQTTAATPAALGAAALVPKKGLRSGDPVSNPELTATPSAPARSGFGRTSGVASLLPSLSM